MFSYLTSLKYADEHREHVATESVAGQTTNDLEDLVKLRGSLGELQHVSLARAGFHRVLRVRVEALHRVASGGRVQPPLVILTVVVEIV